MNVDVMMVINLLLIIMIALVWNIYITKQDLWEILLLNFIATPFDDVRTNVYTYVRTYFDIKFQILYVRIWCNLQPNANEPAKSTEHLRV